MCTAYWPPLYRFARRAGDPSADAQDLVQAFLLDFLERDGVSAASAAKGRFRNYLLAAFRHFRHKAWERANAQKRGGGAALASLDFARAELGFEPHAADASPDRQFLRDWTMALLARARETLRQGYAERGQETLYGQLEAYLAEGAQPDYPALAADLGLSVGSTRVALHRLRGRYRRAVREAIADTLDEPDETAVEAELQALLAALSAQGV